MAATQIRQRSAAEAPAPPAERDGGRSVAARQQSVLRVALVVVGLAFVWWNLGGPRASYDEAFTGLHAELPLGEIAPSLRAEDSHPPLDYYLRHVVAGSHDTGLLRLPSALFASATLLVVARWMRPYGRFGLAMLGFAAVSTPHLLAAHSARPYALMVLAGTVAAATADRWLRAPSFRHEVAIAVTVLVAVFDHASGLLLAGGLLLVPALRRDRAAWRWRAAIATPLAVWAVVWGPVMRDQAAGNQADWIPRTSPSHLLDTINGMATMYPAYGALTVALLVAGGVVLARDQARLAWLAFCLLLVPLVAAATIGATRPFLLSRTLAFATWAVCAALAALADRLLAQPRTRVLAGAALALLFVPSAVAAVRWEELSADATRAIDARIQPGDVVAVHPAWLAPLWTWDHPDGTAVDAPAGIDPADVHAVVTAAGPRTGVVWVLQPDNYELRTTGLIDCGTPTADGAEWVVRCYRVDG